MILLDGEKPARKLLQFFWDTADFRVCADGAAATCVEYLLQPEVILGDLDSLDTDTRNHFRVSKIIKMADQETTDGEKAIQYCIHKNYQVIHILGALGKRVDHTLYNLGLLTKFRHQVAEMTIISNDETVSLITEKKTFAASSGTRISLLPVFGKVENVTTQGLAYPLQKTTLELGHYSSISNRFTGDSATVSISSGQLLVVIERRED